MSSKTLGERAMDFLIEYEEDIGDDGFCIVCGYDMLGGSPHAGDCELGRLIVEIKRSRLMGSCGNCGRPHSDHGAYGCPVVVTSTAEAPPGVDSSS